LAKLENFDSSEFFMQEIRLRTYLRRSFNFCHSQFFRLAAVRF